jgi:epoxide hydrolase-like predicted phosphatase
MGIRAIIWDIGGVLMRTEDRLPRQQLAESLGMTYTELDDLVWNSESGQKAQVGLVTTEAHWKWVAEVLDQSESQIPSLQKRFFAGDRVDGGLIDYIRSLHGPYLCGIITNAIDNVRTLITETWCFADAFDHILISAEAGVMKPDPEIYHQSLQGLGVPAQEAVFIDDFEHNVQGALDVGMYAIHFKDRQQVLRDLETLLDRDKAVQ